MSLAGYSLEGKVEDLEMFWLSLAMDLKWFLRVSASGRVESINFCIFVFNMEIIQILERKK